MLSTLSRVRAVAPGGIWALTVRLYSTQPGRVSLLYGQNIRYERDVSRDPKSKNPQKQGDTPARYVVQVRSSFLRFMLRRLGHAYEIYPLIGLVSFWFTIFCVVTYCSFEKVEVWLDRSQKTAPWDWERLRNNYWKLHTVMSIFDRNEETHKRLEIMEKLQDEMLEAAKKRGTR